jgi:hypothetical protein
MEIYGGIIRLLSTGPVILNDANHAASPRITGVSVDAASGNLIITHDPVLKVISGVITIDETLAGRGIIAGASVGLSQTIVVFYSTVTHSHVRADSAAVTGSSSNIFASWMSEV